MEWGLLAPEQLAMATSAEGGDTRDGLARLVGQGGLDARGFARAVAGRLGLPFIELSDRRIPDEALGSLPPSLVTRHQVMPVEFENETLRVAMVDPLDLPALDNLSHFTGRRIVPGVATGDDIERALVRHYGRITGGTEELTAEVAAGTDQNHSDNASITAGDAPVIRLVESIIGEAAARRASDIHFEPLESRFRIRYRIDGALVEVSPPPRQLQPAIISRLKIMAHLSIAEKRLPQDGRIRFDAAGRSLDLRVSSLPTTHGESVVIRILPADGPALCLPDLGLEPDDHRRIAQLIGAPDGIILVTGPTGSGKTTTLYACLQELNQSDRKIITVEDPIEYQHTGINQVPVRPAVGMTFASALRAMLRQSPNIIMLGEIRDAETAEIALNAALTGHLVFSTLHTNDAPGAVTRLLDIGAKPFLVAAGLRAVVAQRLVRRICPDCRRACTPAPRELRALGLTEEQTAGMQFAHGAGCAACLGTGYRGRVGLFEIFLVHDGIRDMIGANLNAARLRSRARQDGMRTMREDGIRKILAGLTTPEEVI